VRRVVALQAELDSRRLEWISDGVNEKRSALIRITTLRDRAGSTAAQVIAQPLQ
jgi:hypothetical protein